VRGTTCALGKPRSPLARQIDAAALRARSKSGLASSAVAASTMSRRTESAGDAFANAAIRSAGWNGLARMSSNR